MPPVFPVDVFFVMRYFSFQVQYDTLYNWALRGEELVLVNSSTPHISHAASRVEMAECYSRAATRLSHRAPHHPAFFNSSHRNSINSPNTTTNYRTISTFSRRFRQNTMAQISHTQSVTIGDGNFQSGNIGSFNTAYYNSDEDAQIMCWLSPLEPNTRHQGVRTGRFGGVGDWLLETSEFQEWRDGADQAVLFCPGNPGVGKTYLR